MEVFTFTGSEATDRGDFFALMFLVVALGNLVAYCLIGYCTNYINQVKLPTRSITSLI